MTQIRADLGPTTAGRTASVMEPQISQICCRLRACYRTQDYQNILEITKEGGVGGGPCVCARHTSGPGACRAWRASHATLWREGR